MTDLKELQSELAFWKRRAEQAEGGNRSLELELSKVRNQLRQAKQALKYSKPLADLEAEARDFAQRKALTNAINGRF